jgi:O-antigen/teichoic acid export membrane protein
MEHEPAPPVWWGAVQGIWLRNQDLLRNAGSLAATTGLTSVFGFIYWIIAAREFSSQAVGYGSAAISAMMLLGTVGMFGLGTVLIGELPKRRDRGGLIAAALIASGLGSLVLGFAFPIVAAAFGGHFPELSGTPARLLIFAVGVGLTAASLVFDEGTIGLMRGSVQLSRNLVMSLVKLAVLPVMAIALHDMFGVGLILAWVLGTTVSLALSAFMLKRSGSRIFHRPDWELLRGLGKVAMAHNWLNLAIATPPKLIPVLVTIVVSPSANAAFYIAWMLASFLFMVPFHLSTVLFAIASASPELIAEKLRFVLRLSLIIGLPAMALLAIGAHFALGIFGPSYSQLATVPLWLLIIGYIPGLAKTQYIAVCRATGKVNRAAMVLTVAMLCELGAVIVGGKMGGLNGLCIGYTIVVFIEGIVTAPAVLRAAYARTTPATGKGADMATLAAVATAAADERHALDIATTVWRTGGFPADSPEQALRRAQLADTATDLYGDHRGPRHRRRDGSRVSYHSRQHAGIDALIALGTPSASDSDKQTQDPPNNA